MSNQSWRYKVVKSVQAPDGVWISFAAAAVFDYEDDAVRFARAFALGEWEGGKTRVKIEVQTRGRKVIAEYGEREKVPA